MTISNLKELEQLMKLCKKQGVPLIKIDNIEFQIDTTPVVTAKKASKAVAGEVIAPGGITDSTKVESFDALTDEQKLFWSVGQQPEQGQ